MGKRRREECGQSLLELAVILPVLLILLIGLVEIGYALRDYLVVVNATREGCRFAARGYFSGEEIVERVVTSGGMVHFGEYDYPFLRTQEIYETDPNTGIIVTNITTTITGTLGLLDPVSVTVEGVVPDEAGGVRSVAPSDTTISVDQIVERHRETTQYVSEARAAAEYPQVPHQIVVVEVFFMHHPLWNNPFVPLPDPWMMHARSEMRVVAGR